MTSLLPLMARVWVTGFFEGDMLVLDPATGKTKRFPVNGGKPGGDVRALKFAADGGLLGGFGRHENLWFGLM